MMSLRVFFKLLVITSMNLMKLSNTDDNNDDEVNDYDYDDY